MPIKKSELYSSLWKSCDELRGGMDASQYKDYVLVLLFVKYVSDKYAGQKDALLDVPEGGRFADMVALKGDKEIGDKMNKIITRLAEANDLKGVIDVADFNDESKLGKGKEMVDRLSNLVAIFNNPALDFRGNRAEGDDLLGDAYEYLMRHFATESGKSKGQFYTPAEVSRIMAKVIGIGGAKSPDQSIYDPTCGSGSLLLKAHDEAKGSAGLDLAIYGQEMDVATTALSKMNMILHDCPTAEIAPGGSSTLANPFFRSNQGTLKTFDYVVANPPFSFKAWTSGFNPAEDEFKRFPYGIPPAKNGDFAFFLHILASLKSTGKAAVNLPHGVLFRGGAEGDIRREIVRRGYIKGIIGLPANLFYGTGIPACIVVLDKEDAAARTGIFMVDASKGFIKDGNKNRLRAQDIHKIVDIFTRQLDVPRYSRMVPLAEVEANDFNLNLPRYVDSSEPEDLQDIDAHLRGGIPNRDVDALAAYWQVFPAVRAALFEPAGRPGYCQLKVKTSDVKATIFGHAEFADFNQEITGLLEKWKKDHATRLKAIAVGDKPKTLIETLSEDLLGTFRCARLLDAYDVYQHLMNYWAETMQDDVYMVVGDGWKEAIKPGLIIEDKDNRNKEKADFTIGKLKYKAELAPPALLIARYFLSEQADIDNKEAEVASIEQAMEELKEEHSGEEGLLADVIDENGKIAKGAVTTRLKEIKDDKDYADERAALDGYVTLINQKSEADKKLKEATKALEAKVATKYGQLSEAEIKTLVVDDKWLATLAAAVQTELDRVSQALTGRVRQLAERYATPLPQLTNEVATLAARVNEHLKKMGAVWN
jgi:type I restriction enzyme M protein